MSIEKKRDYFNRAAGIELLAQLGQIDLLILKDILDFKFGMNGEIIGQLDNDRVLNGLIKISNGEASEDAIFGALINVNYFVNAAMQGCRRDSGRFVCDGVSSTNPIDATISGETRDRFVLQIIQAAEGVAAPEV